MTGDGTTRREVLRTILACLEDEIARRADGAEPGAVLFGDEELDALAALLRQEADDEGGGR